MDAYSGPSGPESDDVASAPDQEDYFALFLSSKAGDLKLSEETIGTLAAPENRYNSSVHVFTEELSCQIDASLKDSKSQAAVLSILADQIPHVHWDEGLNAVLEVAKKLASAGEHGKDEVSRPAALEFYERLIHRVAVEKGLLGEVVPLLRAHAAVAGGKGVSDEDLETLTHRFVSDDTRREIRHMFKTAAGGKTPSETRILSAGLLMGLEMAGGFAIESIKVWREESEKLNKLSPDAPEKLQLQALCQAALQLTGYTGTSNYSNIGNLVTALRSDNRQFRQAAQHSLSKLGEVTVDRITEELALGKKHKSRVLIHLALAVAFMKPNTDSSADLNVDPNIDPDGKFSDANKGSKLGNALRARALRAHKSGDQVEEFAHVRALISLGKHAREAYSGKLAALGRSHLEKLTQESRRDPDENRLRKRERSVQFYLKALATAGGPEALRFLTDVVHGSVREGLSDMAFELLTKVAIAAPNHKDQSIALILLRDTDTGRGMELIGKLAGAAKDYLPKHSASKGGRLLRETVETVRNLVADSFSNSFDQAMLSTDFAQGARFLLAQREGDDRSHTEEQLLMLKASFTEERIGKLIEALKEPGTRASAMPLLEIAARVVPKNFQIHLEALESIRSADTIGVAAVGVFDALDL